MQQRLINRVEELLQQGNNVMTTKRLSRDGYSEVIDYSKMLGFRVAVLSFIERVYGVSHTHYQEFLKHINGDHVSSPQIAMSILQTIHDEIAGDWLFSVKGLVTAEVFSDFIDMANYLVAQEYKDAAAVIAGSVLEEHIRQLCQSNGIDLEVSTANGTKPKKADQMNADLAGASVYSKLDQKAVTMWFDLRNKAAHGKYSEYNQVQVENMIAGITEFMARNSA